MVLIPYACYHAQDNKSGSPCPYYIRLKKNGTTVHTENHNCSDTGLHSFSGVVDVQNGDVFTYETNRAIQSSLNSSYHRWRLGLWHSGNFSNYFFSSNPQTHTINLPARYSPLYLEQLHKFNNSINTRVVYDPLN